VFWPEWICWSECIILLFFMVPLKTWSLMDLQHHQLWQCHINSWFRWNTKLCKLDFVLKIVHSASQTSSPHVNSNFFGDSWDKPVFIHFCKDWYVLCKGMCHRTTYQNSPVHTPLLVFACKQFIWKVHLILCSLWKV